MAHELRAAPGLFRCISWRKSFKLDLSLELGLRVQIVDFGKVAPTLYPAALSFVEILVCGYAE